MSKKITVSARAYQKVFNSDEGKIVLKELMKMCYLKDPTFDGDTNAMIFREGARGVVLHIFNKLNIDITKLEIILKERDNDAESF